MNELYRTVDVDPNKVLATSWSYGGYIAHYLVNKHPERFSCLVAKQSNFSAALLDPKNVPRYWDHKIAIFYTENDFALCKRESRQAVEWYAKHGFDLTHAVFEKKGHERTPGVAAEFFARTCGLEAKTPPVELAQMQVINIKPQDANRSPRSSQSLARQLSSMHALAPRGSGSTGSPVEVASVESPFPRTGWRSAQPGSDLPPATRDTTYGVRRFPPNAGTGTGSPRRTPPGGPIRIRLSATIGVAPLLVSYSAFIPQPLRRKAHLLWTDNGEPISNGLNGQKVFSDPGEHKLEVLVTTADGREYRVSRVISVIERPSSGSR